MKKISKKRLIISTFIILVLSVQNVYAAECGILSNELTELLNNLLSMVQYIAPILVAVFTIKDFVMAAISGNQDDTKKAFRKLTKRLIAAACLFFIPVVLKVVFVKAGITSGASCIEAIQN